MQDERGLLGKRERQRLIASVVARKRIGTQHALGRPRYEVPPDRERRRPDPRAALNAVLAQFGRQATAAQNIVVVQSELGTAPAIARALDRTAHPRIVGTLAGDDTVLVVVRDARAARSLAAELSEAIG